MRPSIAVLLMSFGTLWGAGRPWPEEYVKEVEAANKSCGAKEYAACREHLLKLRDLVDGRADVIYKLATVEAAIGKPAAALEWLTVYAKSGLTFAKPESDPEFAPMRDNPEFKSLLTRIEGARQPVSSSHLFVTLPENDLIAEDIAYDPVGRRFYVSSVRHRKILCVDSAGRTGDFLPEGQPGIWALMALGIDPERRYLWASTMATPEALGYSAADEGRSALLKYSLASGKLLKRYDLPSDTKHALGDMTVSPAGDVFISDGNGPVYWVDHRQDTLKVLIGAGTFRSPQTPALTPDGRRLLVPDYSRGISLVDLASRQTRLLRHPAELSLGGIDGLYLAGQTMIAVQNGTEPERLIRMHLDSGLTSVLSWETLEANWPGLGDPTHGVVVDGQFYFVANSGWDQFGDNGKLKPGAAFSAPTIRGMPLNAKPQTH